MYFTAFHALNRSHLMVHCQDREARLQFKGNLEVTRGNDGCCAMYVDFWLTIKLVKHMKMMVSCWLFYLQCTLLYNDIILLYLLIPRSY